MNEKLLNEIDDYFLKKYHEVVVLDGIIQLEEYKKAEPKILWVLKETNTIRKGQITPDYSDLREALNICIKNNDLAGFSKTYNKIMKVSYIILKHHNENLMCDCKTIFPKLAIINVKKAAGTKKSEDTEINQYCNEDKDIILKQIEAINPDIIINASRVWAVIKALNIDNIQNISQSFGKKKYSFQVGIQQIQDKKRIVLNVNHPNCHISDIGYIGLIKQCFDKL